MHLSTARDSAASWGVVPAGRSTRCAEYRRPGPPGLWPYRMNLSASVGGWGGAGRRARQRTVVEVPDLVVALSELPAVAGALVAVVLDRVVQLRATVLEADEFGEVGTAGGGVAVQPDRARVGGLHEVVHQSRYPLPPGADLLPADASAVRVKNSVPEHLLQQALGKHRRDDRVLGAVPGPAPRVCGAGGW